MNHPDLTADEYAVTALALRAIRRNPHLVPHVFGSELLLGAELALTTALEKVEHHLDTGGA